MKNVIVMLALVMVAAGASAQVQRDPFARPALPVASKIAASDALEPRAAPQLRAVMYEPGKSLVNIDGRILAVVDRLDD